jgi:hypothetical protein
VHLDILSGRESVRGTLGGNAPVTLQGGSVMLQVPGGSLPEDLALEIEEAESLSTFLPRSTDAELVSEFTLDFSTARLSQSGVLSIPASAVGESDTVVFARVERGVTAGVPKLVAVAVGQRSGDG